MLWLFVSRQPGGSSKHKPEKIVKITREQDANMSRCYCEPAFKHQRQLRDKTSVSVRPGCTIEELHLFLKACDRGERFIQTADKVLKTKGPANPGRCSGSSTHITNSQTGTSMQRHTEHTYGSTSRQQPKHKDRSPDTFSKYFFVRPLSVKKIYQLFRKGAGDVSVTHFLFPGISASYGFCHVPICM